MVKNIKQPLPNAGHQELIADRRELEAILRRACNTLAPEQTPSFVQPLFDALETGVPVRLLVMDQS